MHKIEWKVETGDTTHELPLGAEVVFYLQKDDPNTKVVVRYISNPHAEEDARVEVLLPNGKRVVSDAITTSIFKDV